MFTVDNQSSVILFYFTVEFYNSQVLLKGCEEKGYVIISTAKASLLTSDHCPVWREQTLRSKSTIVGSVDSVQVQCMCTQCRYMCTLWREQTLRKKIHQRDATSCLFLQYYATINPAAAADDSTSAAASDSATSQSCDDDQPIAWLSDEQFEEEDECIMGREYFSSQITTSNKYASF